MLVDISCNNKDEFKEIDKFLMSIELDKPPCRTCISVFYNDSTHYYKIVEAFGKWRVVTD